MGPVRAAVKFTYSEYHALPETGPRCQLIEGDLVMTPAPSSRHQIISGRFYRALSDFAERGNLGIVLYAPLDVILSPEDVLQPDLMFVSNARRHLLVPEGVRGGPDLCVEILSDRSKGVDRGVKRVLYARHGVTEYWIVDPEAGAVEVYRLQENAEVPFRTFPATGVLVTPLLPGFALDLRGVFLP
jgi:Uma2 family endonuclease